MCATWHHIEFCVDINLLSNIKSVIEQQQRPKMIIYRRMYIKAQWN